MKILYFGDIFAKPGRRAVAAVLPKLKERYQPDFLLGNIENLSGGRGANRKSLDEMWELGFSGFTSGNHIWDNREILSIFETEKRIFRPANFPAVVGNPCPGIGSGILESNGKQLFVINLMGRVFMDPVDCPFKAVNQILEKTAVNCPIFVDMHAEATSEKYAMGFHLDGRVAAVVGTHTHIQTNDARLLPKGTAYISDVGMTGSFDSVIGMGYPEVVRKFVSKRPQRVQPAAENPGFGCVVIELDEQGGALSIKPIRQTLAHFESHQGNDWPQ